MKLGNLYDTKIKTSPCFFLVLKKYISRWHPGGKQKKHERLDFFRPNKRWIHQESERGFPRAEVVATLMVGFCFMSWWGILPMVVAWCQCNKHHQNFLRSKCQWVLICVQLKHQNQAVGETFDSYKLGDIGLMVGSRSTRQRTRSKVPTICNRYEGIVPLNFWNKTSLQHVTEFLFIT